MASGCFARSPAPEDLEEPVCPVCGTAESRLIADAGALAGQARDLDAFHLRRMVPGTPPAMLADKTDFTQCYPTNVVACTGCGLLYRCPRPTAGAIVQRYARDQYGREKMDSLFAGETPFYRRKRAALRRRLPAGSRILEVGSFVGAFLHEARDAGWDATGVDVGDEVTAYAQSRGLRALRGEVVGLDLQPATFDAVCIWNCFDQIPEPRPVLRRVADLLRPGGLLVLRVPNGAFFRLGASLLRHPSPARLRAMATAALALNNLLTFPYLYGYTAGTLRRLLAPYDLRVQGFVSDVLVPLADPYTARWAAVEEARVKCVLRFFANLAASASAGRWVCAPWIEVFAVRG